MRTSPASKSIWDTLLIKKYKPDCFIEFQSNGILMLKNKNIEKLLKCWVNLFNINYPCHISVINDQIAWVPWTLPIREKAMKKIIELGGKLRINIIVNTVNLSYIPQMIQYISETFHWFERIQLSFTKAMWAADRNKQVVPQYEEAEPYFIEALKIGKKLGIKIDVDHIPMCFLWPYFLNHVDYHKMEKQEEGVYMIEKNYVEKCNSCTLKSKCTGYRKDYLGIYDIKQNYV